MKNALVYNIEELITTVKSLIVEAPLRNVGPIGFSFQHMASIL